MTAFLDDAAASDSPPRAEIGPAASSFPGGADIWRENFHTHYSAEAIVHCLRSATPAPGGATPPSTPAPPSAPGG